MISIILPYPIGFRYRYDYLSTQTTFTLYNRRFPLVTLIERFRWSRKDTSKNRRYKGVISFRTEKNIEYIFFYNKSRRDFVYLMLLSSFLLFVSIMADRRITFRYFLLKRVSMEIWRRGPTWEGFWKLT